MTGLSSKSEFNPNLDATAWRYGDAQTQGKRNYQEDECGGDNGQVFNGEPLLLAVLADGMGGQAGGAVASRTAVETFLDAFAAKADTPSPARLKHALNHANREIGLKADIDPSLEGMGCTLIGTVIHDGHLYWTSVGDSLLLLYRRGQLKRLNKDHSLGAELDAQAAQGVITKEEARDSNRRHYLTSAINGRPLRLIDDGRSISLQARDIIILASDGLVTLKNTRISEILSACSRDDATDIAERLIDAVEGANRPHQDNTTVVVLKHGPEAVLPPPTKAEQLRELLANRMVGIAAIGLLSLIVLVLLIAPGTKEPEPTVQVVPMTSPEPPPPVVTEPITKEDAAIEIPNSEDGGESGLTPASPNAADSPPPEADSSFSDISTNQSPDNWQENSSTQQDASDQPTYGPPLPPPLRLQIDPGLNR